MKQNDFTQGNLMRQMLILPAHALGTAATSMAGQNIGTKNWKRVHTIVTPSRGSFQTI